MEILSEIDILYNDRRFYGIIVQPPFDCDANIEACNIINSVYPSQDVNGLNVVNAGKISHGQLKEASLVRPLYNDQD